MIQPNHVQIFILEVDLIDQPVGPENIIHHLQFHELEKPCQMVFYQGQEDSLNGVNGFS